jgi:magnesium-transporting ATPase (P-type)
LKLFVIFYASIIIYKINDYSRKHIDFSIMSAFRNYIVNPVLEFLESTTTRDRHSKIARLVHSTGATVHYYNGNVETMPADIRCESQPNRITTNKYNILTWLPMSLYVQFHNIANCYFLFIIIIHFILQSVYNNASPIISPWPILLPFFIVLGITALQDGLSDFSTWRLDKAQNEGFAHRAVFNERGKCIGVEKIQTQDLRIGDFIVVLENERLPCDALPLVSSNVSGAVHISTKSLDGETNLKLRRCPAAIGHLFDDQQDLFSKSPCFRKDAAAEIAAHTHADTYFVRGGKDDWHGQGPITNPQEYSAQALRKLHLLHHLSRFLPPICQRIAEDFRLISQAPRAALYEADARLFVHDSESALDINNFLLGDSILRNTKWTLAMAVFTGANTKSHLNSHRVSKKFSRLTKALDITVLAILVVWLNNSGDEIFAYRPRCERKLCNRSV